MNNKGSESFDEYDISPLDRNIKDAEKALAAADEEGKPAAEAALGAVRAEDTPKREAILKACEAFCVKYYSDAAPHVGGVDRLVAQITGNPNGILGTVKTDRWAHHAKIVLIGDASHAMVPFFGQGCNCGFEDVYWLSRLLDEHCGGGPAAGEAAVVTPATVKACFAALGAERKPNADAICDMALENFVEMRDKTADRKFLAMRRVENKLENLSRESFRSRYAMVCYGGAGNVSYANAKALGPVIDEILTELSVNMVDGPDGNIRTDEEMQSQIDLVDMALAQRLVDDKLVPELRNRGMDLTTVKH